MFYIVQHLKQTNYFAFIETKNRKGDMQNRKKKQLRFKGKYYGKIDKLW